MKILGANSKSLYIHLPIVLGCSILLYFFSSVFDFYEEANFIIHKYENFNIDEILIVALFLAGYLSIWSISATVSLRRKNKIIEKLSQELQEEINAKNVFHSIIAHDLRAPFNTLIGFSDLLVKKPELVNSDKGEKMIAAINKTSRNSYELLENLLNWSSIQKGSIVPDKAAVNLSLVVSNAISVLESSLEKKELILETNVPADDYVFADKEMLKLIIRNLLSNSIKYSYPKGKIEISCEAYNHTVSITLKDNGVGLTSSQIKNLFSEKISTTPGTKNEKGFGLGLKVCKEFIESNQGIFTIDSKEGQGASFSFTVPRFEQTITD